jgi:tRNA modification GTPase
MSSLRSGKKISDYKSHTIAYGAVINQEGDTIDHVLFLIMHGPHTFTGEHTVEITCHNNPFIIESIIEIACAHGARLAKPGEFTERAVLNDRIDMVKAEAINEIIHANTQQGLKLALSQLEGSLSSWIRSIEEQLLNTLALCNASFEFIEEDNITFDETIRNSISGVENEIKALQKTFDAQKQIREGVRIALIGSVNAGKSSLFNTLIGTERAIVTDIAGTTRDSIEAGLYRYGSYITLIDTAGLRQTDDKIESIGIERSYQEAAKADIILLVIDGSRVITAQEQIIYDDIQKKYAHKIIFVLTKKDLPQEQSVYRDALSVSTRTQENMDILEDTMKNVIQEKLSSESPFLLNKRQIRLVTALATHIETIQSMLSGEIPYELVAAELTECLSNLSELTGKSISESSMDAVFRQFCVGK